MIFWNGTGIIVPAFSIVALVLAVVLNEVFTYYGIPLRWSGLLALAITTPIAAALIWYIAMRIGGRPKRILIDAATGEEVAIKADAGSFMFIPTRFWAFGVLGLGLFFGYVISLPPVDDRPVTVTSTLYVPDGDATAGASSDSAVAAQ